MLRVSILCFAVVVLLAVETFACRCKPAPPPKDALKASVGVFAGEVVATKVQGRFLLATVKISQSWKGKPAKESVVRTSSSEASCGYGFKAGEKYLIYCSGKQSGTWVTNLCTRTRTLAAAQEDLDALGPGSANASAEKRKISVAFDAPATNYRVRIQAVFRVGDQLWVISKVSTEGDIGGDAITKVKDEVSVEADEKLPVRHIVLGKTWNWGKNTKQLQYVKDANALTAEIKKNMGERIWQREKPKS